MPVQGLTLPWDVLLDAEMERLEALRTDDPVRQAAALADLEAAREVMRCVGGLLVSLGLESREVQKKLARVFGSLARAAWERATAAAEQAEWAAVRVAALEARVRELEKRLANLTPGVGEPGRVK